jgi:uncharacterized protein
MMLLRQSVLMFAVCVMAIGSLPTFAQDQWKIDLERPGDRDFIVDRADLLTSDQEEEIRSVANQLLTDKAAPIIVVTINSMNEHAPGIDNIESFAMLLFNQWGIGFSEAEGQKSWNYGILLVVSQGDRKARIELGADWGREKDKVCQQIMDDLIVAKFKEGDFGGGIMTGVSALDKMARGLEVPQPPKPAWYYPSMAIIVGLSIFTAISLYRRGASGWAWLFWGVVFTVLFVILKGLASGSSSGGGGYSGGSFGGGFSGGGGASGSW